MNSTVRLGTPDVILVRYGELALKGGNRQMFEDALIRNIRAALEDVTKVRVKKMRGRLLVFVDSRIERASERLQDVFGIKSVSPGWMTETEPAAILELAQRVLQDALDRRPSTELITFRVSTKRAEKRFPYNSPEFDRYVADQVLRGHENRLKVQLKNPELELGLDVRPGKSFVFVDRLPGPGGLPVGTLGKGICLLSGGIDSPVAAWMAMKRGLRVGYATFHSYPFIGEASRKKTLDLARVLSRYQPASRLWVVPFTEIQTTIRDTAPEGYRTVLYRRMMQRISSKLAFRWGAGALITGESLGQVASQTLENMTCIEEASKLPVLRPLVCYDKEETIDIAERIGTMEVSNIQEPDCCTVFMPKKPVIRGKLEVCLEAEERMNMDELLENALQNVEVENV